MKLVTALFLSALALTSVIPQQLHAEPSKARDTATLLFDHPDWAVAPAGSKITYAYSRKTAPDLGPSFDDTIDLSLEAGDSPQSRKVEVRMFSAMRRVPAGPFDSTSTNPVLLLMFENHLQEIARLFQANPRYLKNAIRKAWRESPTIEDVSLTVGGKAVPGTRITINPFVNDPMKDRMKGLDGLTYVVDIADSVPGEIVAIDIHTPEGAPMFSETLHYETEKTP